MTTRTPVTPLPLPPGARMFKKPKRVQAGNWVEMSVDASLKFAGVRWLRAEGGFGNGQHTGWHPREDWIADLPEVCISVSRHFDKPDEWEHDKVCTMEQAMKRALREGLRGARFRRPKLKRELTDLDFSIEALAEATS